MSFLRVLVRLALPGLIAVGFLIDDRIQAVGDSGAEITGPDTENSVPGTNSLTSTWYCPMAHSRKLDTYLVGFYDFLYFISFLWVFFFY